MNTEPLKIDVIGFDADDTLWHNEPLFTTSENKLRKLLSPYHSDHWIDQRLYETEIKNLKIFGYGVKGFTLSMIETAIELTEGRIQGNEIQRIINSSKEMLKTPVQLLDHVAEVIAGLASLHTLMLITKGDLFEQESKLARSGLADHFKFVEIVSEKNADVYQKILKRHRIAPERFLMVGNSMKSDILPVLSLGARAIYIHYETTWQHEKVTEEEAGNAACYRVESIAELPSFIEKLTGLKS